jgi:hypothetical protein
VGRCPLLNDIFLAPQTERYGIDALVAHDPHRRSRGAVQIDHPENALAQVSFQLHLKREVVILEAPAGAVEGRGIVEANAVIEGLAAEEAVLGPGHEIGGFRAASIDCLEIRARLFAERTLAAGVGADASEFGAVFSIYRSMAKEENGTTSMSPSRGRTPISSMCSMI